MRWRDRRKRAGESGGHKLAKMVGFTLALTTASTGCPPPGRCRATPTRRWRAPRSRRGPRACPRGTRRPAGTRTAARSTGRRRGRPPARRTAWSARCRARRAAPTTRGPRASSARSRRSSSTTATGRAWATTSSPRPSTPTCAGTGTAGSRRSSREGARSTRRSRGADGDWDTPYDGTENRPHSLSLKMNQLRKRSQTPCDALREIQLLPT